MNFSGLALGVKKQELMIGRKNVRSSMNSLDNKLSDYYEHHQHLINVYSDMIDTLDEAIKDAETIGQGV